MMFLAYLRDSASRLHPAKMRRNLTGAHSLPRLGANAYRISANVSLSLTWPSFFLVSSLQVFCSGAIMTSIPITTTTLSSGQTAYGISGLPPLTTVFTPPGSCSTRWIQPDSNTLEVWSGVGRFESGVSANYWAQCNAFELSLQAYSPGICSGGHQLVEIMVQDYSTSTALQRQRQYIGMCCPRFVNTPSFVRDHVAFPIY